MAIPGIGNFYVGDCPAVGGFLQPVNQLAVAGPYVALVGLVAAATVVLMTVRKRQ